MTCGTAPCERLGAGLRVLWQGVRAKPNTGPGPRGDELLAAAASMTCSRPLAVEPTQPGAWAAHRLQEAYVMASVPTRASQSRMFIQCMRRKGPSAQMLSGRPP